VRQNNVLVTIGNNQSINGSLTLHSREPDQIISFRYGGCSLRLFGVDDEQRLVTSRSLQGHFAIKKREALKIPLRNQKLNYRDLVEM
jgi:hypothetical protein